VEIRSQFSWNQSTGSRRKQIGRGISEKEAATLQDRILEFLKATLRKGDPIIILGLGKFAVRSKIPRKGWNFKTSESLIIPAHSVATFHPNAALTTEVNSLQTERQAAVTRTG
jgi:DNA-binding protein HU-beta